MANLSQERREKMLAFLETLKEQHSDDESLIALGEIERELKAKKYGLVWEEHEEAVDVKMRTHIPVFTADDSKEIHADSTTENYNFLLEGDNLHSLKLLQKTHRGAIDLIYIDPPYNTGSKDFVYDDSYVDEQDTFRHSKWLSFMRERLVIAHSLLSIRGVVFIQISDIELANLKCLCDDIFGEENYLNILNVNMKNIAGASGGGEDKRFKKNCEYILVYAKNYDFVPLFNGAYTFTEMSEVVEQYRIDNKTWHYTSVLVDEGEKEYVGSTVDGDGNEIKIFKRNNAIIKSVNQVIKSEGLSEKEVYYKYGSRIFEAKDAQSSIRTRVINAKQELGITDDVISIEYVPKTGKHKGVVYEQFYKGDKCRLFAWLSDISEIIDGVLYKKTLQGTYWDFTSKINNLTKEGAVEFANGKKPVDLIKQIISLYPSNCIKVLDFFAGSGTTGHAVLLLNAEDEGNRSFILCTNNENNICEQKTYKRLKNVVEGITVKGQNDDACLPTNLMYFRTDFVDKESDELSDELLAHIREMIQLEHGIKIDGRKYVVILTEEEMDEFEKNIAKYPNLKAVFINSDIFLSAKQQKMLNNVDSYVIPDYYFDFELREAGEIW